METAIYSFGGLNIASDFPLGEVHACRDTAEVNCQVVMRCVQIPDKAASTSAKISNGHYSGTYDGRDIFIEYSQIGRFLLRGGEEILIDLAPSSDEGGARAFLLGALFGALCHQRGITPLHASAFDTAGGFVAFVGSSGAGKSTLIATLARRGQEIVADDECFLKLGDDGKVQAWPGTRGIRLREDARGALGFTAPQAKRGPRGNKYFIPVDGPRDPMQPRPLCAVYQLARGPNRSAEVTRLRGSDAVEAIIQNVYPSGFADRFGYHSRVFGVCAAIARDIPVYRLARPWNLVDLDQSLRVLEPHLRDAL